MQAQNMTSLRGGCAAALSRQGWREDPGWLSSGQAAALAGNELGATTSPGLGLLLLPRGLGLTRDVGVLQACRHLPLVHL